MLYLLRENLGRQATSEGSDWKFSRQRKILAIQAKYYLSLQHHTDITWESNILFAHRMTGLVASRVFCIRQLTI